MVMNPAGATSITRRQFLNLSSTGVAAAGLVAIAPLTRFRHLLEWFDFSQTRTSDNLNNLIFTNSLRPNQQGRVLNASIDVFDVPSFSGTRVNSYWRDWILPITNIRIGKSEDSFNLVWYKIGNEGYAHSGGLQPVLTETNPIVRDIPPGGALAVVTVPFTDAHWDPGDNEPVAYRFYYATTYWVIETVNDANGITWYGVRDDKWEYMFYVPAAHLRIIPADEVKPISPDVPAKDKKIEVHLSEQFMIAYEYNQPVFMARIASGAKFSNGDFSTPAGRYMTFHKRASRHMARGNLAANGYDLPGVPWNSYIT